MLINAPDDMKRGIGHRVSAMVAAAAPPAAMIEGMDRLGFDLTHVYGLTEVYGPATVCARQPHWATLEVGERAMLNGRQGVRYTLQEGVAVLVCTVGKTVLHYDARCLADLHAMLKKHGDWMDLGGADEQKSAKDGTVEAWGRSADNPIGGWYGLKKGLRGRFGVYIPPLMEALGLCELEHQPKNNRMRAK
jgi:hypothetical protein